MIWSFIFVTGGGTLNKDNQEQLKQSVRYYQEISEDLFLIADYVDQFILNEEKRPSEAEVITWVDVQSDIDDHVKNFHLTLHFEKYPSHITDEFGLPTSKGYSIDLWTGDQHLFYASWVNDNSANVSIEDFGIPRTHSLLHVIGGLLLVIYLFSKTRTKVNVETSSQ